MIEQSGPTHSTSQAVLHTPSGLSEEHIRHLMHMLEHTHEGMYSCEETFDLLDEYVELVASHEEAAMLMPYVQRHLDLCPDCLQAYEALMRILRADFPTDFPADFPSVA